MLIMEFHFSIKIIIFSFLCCFDIVKFMMGRSNRKRSKLSAPKKQLSRAESVRSGNISPLVNSFVTILASSQALGQKMFNVFHSGFGETIAFRVIRRRDFVYDVVSSTPFTEITTELGTAV